MSHKHLKLTLLAALLLIVTQISAAQLPDGKGKGSKKSSPVEWLVAFDQFENGTDDWPASASQAVCGSADQQLGVFGVYGSGKVSPLSKTYAVTGEHSHLRIQASVTFLDQWLGESVSLSVDGEEVWIETWHHCPAIFGSLCAGINLCGDENFADRAGRSIDVIIPHTGNSVTLTFETGLAKTTNASLMADDIRISAF